MHGQRLYTEVIHIIHGGKGFVFGTLRCAMNLQFRLETIYFDNNKYCHFLLNKFILFSVAERNK